MIAYGRGSRVVGWPPCPTSPTQDAHRVGRSLTDRRTEPTPRGGALGQRDLLYTQGSQLPFPGRPGAAERWCRAFSFACRSQGAADASRAGGQWPIREVTGEPTHRGARGGTGARTTRELLSGYTLCSVCVVFSRQTHRPPSSSGRPRRVRPRFILEGQREDAAGSGTSRGMVAAGGPALVVDFR